MRRSTHISKLYILITLIATSPLLALPVSAQSPPGSPHGMFDFAQHLAETGEYYRAITEFKRFLFHWPDHELAGACRYRIGLSYLRGSQFDTAITLFRELQYDPQVGVKPEEVFEALGASLYFGNYFQQAENLLINRKKKTPEMKYNLTWCYLQQRDTENAVNLWSDPPDDSTEALQQAINRLADIPQKKPGIAGTLSALLPGSGQIYAGRWRDGVVSFLVNGLFIGAIAVAIDRDHTETAAVLGFFELGFYSANIYNAMNNVHKSNEAIWNHHLEALESQFGSPFSILETRNP